MDLSAYLDAAAQCRYSPGKHDCITFLAGWVDGISGTTFGNDVRYSTKWRGLAQHAPAGVCNAVRAALVGAGWIEVEADAIKDGDVVLTDLDHPGIWHRGTIRCQPVGCAGGLFLNARHAKGGLRWVP